MRRRRPTSRRLRRKTRRRRTERAAAQLSLRSAPGKRAMGPAPHDRRALRRLRPHPNGCGAGGSLESKLVAWGVRIRIEAAPENARRSRGFRDVEKIRRPHAVATAAHRRVAAGPRRASRYALKQRGKPSADDLRAKFRISQNHLIVACACQTSPSNPLGHCLHPQVAMLIVPLGKGWGNLHAFCCDLRRRGVRGACRLRHDHPWHL